MAKHGPSWHETTQGCFIGLLIILGLIAGIMIFCAVLWSS
jgi:hypothetical protein